MSHNPNTQSSRTLPFRRALEKPSARVIPRPNLRDRGFALVVTVSMMVLLAVVALGLLSLSTISLRSSSLAADTMVARANARLALSMALGELQRSLGPDARASARAETLAKDSRIGTSVSANTPKAWWVGVSHSDGSTPIGTENNDVVWLVSGLPDGNIAGSLNDPVKMMSSGTLDLTEFTGGEDIKAGRVSVRDNDGNDTGSYAWIVDDHGMKAQLAADHPDVRNDNDDHPSGGVLAASYQPGILDDMSALEAVDDDELQKAGWLGDYELVGLNTATAKSKYFAFTALSHGVLSDTRNGGLKKDLTIAFERSAVFDKVFPSSDEDKYLVIDPDKRPTELVTNGYINWGIFNAYYNLKKYITTVSRTPVLRTNTFTKEGLYNGTSSATQGTAGPHEFTFEGLPYGETGTYVGSEYILNPIFPVLSHLQQNAWVEYTAPASSTDRHSLTTHVQLWTSHYNPYNIGIRAYNDGNTGPRVINYPMTEFSVSSVFTRGNGLRYDRQQVHASGDVVIPAGRAQVFGFEADRDVGREADNVSYSNEVKDLTFESVQGTYKLTQRASMPRSVTVTAEFFQKHPALIIGVDDKSGSYECSQVFFTPYAWDKIAIGSGSVESNVDEDESSPSDLTKSMYGVTGYDRLGQKISQTLSSSELNENSMMAHALTLRTTREGNSTIRPLIDANVRAQWNNPRWDSPLGLNVVATHSMDLEGEAEENFVPMSVDNPPYGYSYNGSGHSPSTGTERVILFDVPRRDLVSLGQLQHAAAGRFSYEPSYIVGNSYANPRIPMDAWTTSVTDSFATPDGDASSLKISGSFNLYDSSYLVNEMLWDSYIFTTIPQLDDNYGGNDASDDFDALLERTAMLPNSRFIPYEPAGSSFDSSVLQDTGSATEGSFYHNAGHLLVDGAFNVNSTSVDAWEAFLSGTYELPVAEINESGVLTGYKTTDKVRFPRAASHLGDAMETSSIDDNYWTGFRALEQDEVREIAAAIVTEIKTRGPFLRLADFVNRELTDGDNGKAGTLQAALDKTVNDGLDSDYEEDASFSNVTSDSTQGAGFPGQLLQGDVLQSLAPFMTVHSDTFTIRAYGEAKNAGTGNVTATAWCEAVVQRVPDPMPVSSGGGSTLEELANPSSEFGRQFKIRSFRWLNSEEI